MNALLNHNAMRSLVALLASDHVIMQNEGLVSIVTLLTCGSGKCGVQIHSFLFANLAICSLMPEILLYFSKYQHYFLSPVEGEGVSEKLTLG